METRELRYFVAVAEMLHFGRAAESLGMAQPPLSRAIQQLERRLGVDLFDRSARQVRLTAAGSTLLREGRAALDAVLAAERRTRRAGSVTEPPTLVLVTKAGASVELLAKLVDAYAAEPDAIRLDVMLCGPAQQEQALRDGRADVGLLHLPFDSVAGLDTEELSSEAQVALVPAGHPLSVASDLTLAELSAADLPLPRWPAPDGNYPPGPGPEVHNHQQLVQLIGLGRTLAVLPESADGRHHPGVVAVPIRDAPRVTTVIAWPPQSTSLPLAALVRTAIRL